MEPVFIKNLKNRMRKTLPGKVAQERMMVRPHILRTKLFNSKNHHKPAAVLILLYPTDGEWWFFLTKRTENVDHHKGQISFPGGMLEKNESKEEAAIRETYEEIGIPPQKIKIIGQLTPFFIPVSGFKIFPFVGWLEKKQKTKIHTAEVEQIFSTSINTLMKDEIKKEKNDVLAGSKVTIPYFDIEDKMVWGATSIILSEFKYILLETI